MLLEGTHKGDVVFESAGKGDRTNGGIAADEHICGTKQTTLQHISVAAYSEGFLVNAMQMGAADIDLRTHLFDAPLGSGVIIDRLP